MLFNFYKKCLNFFIVIFLYICTLFLFDDLHYVVCVCYVFASTSILSLINVITGINSSASQSPVSSLSVSDFNAVDTSASSLSRSNIVDSSVNKSDIEDNLEDLQRNNHDTEHTHSNSNDSNADSDHDNQVEASKKTIGIGKILQI